MSHGKLVAAIASRYRHASIDRDDLINAGHLGLHTAIQRFDPERFETRLSAYASIWIRWHIQDFIRRNTGPVRLPESKAHRQLAQSGRGLVAEARKACEREGVEATASQLHERIGRRIGLSADEVAQGLRLLLDGGRSLNAAGADLDGPEFGLADQAAPTDDDMNERMDHDRLRARVRGLADEVLGERERLVFLSRTMAATDHVPSLEEFAVRFGVSVARVHQIEASARRKIAAALGNAGLTDRTGDGAVARLAQVRARRRPNIDTTARETLKTPVRLNPRAGSKPLLAIGD